MLRVKICGITNVQDAEWAARCGADAIGFVFAKSPRKVTRDTARSIRRSAGLKKVAAVGVFVDEDTDRMLRTAEHCGLNAIQLHGDEGAGVIRRLQGRGFQIFKALRVGDREDLKKAAEIPADALLFDTSAAGRFGGTGRTFDWEILKKQAIELPWFVSGGLDPRNVKKLLSILKPYGVDVSSGVESSPGKKSAKLVKEFIQNARAAG